MLDSDDEITPPPSSKAVRLLLEMKETEQPITLAINGKIVLPIRDEPSFEKLLTLVEWLDTVELLRERLEKAGERTGSSIEEVKARLREKHGIPH